MMYSGNKAIHNCYIFPLSQFKEYIFWMIYESRLMTCELFVLKYQMIYVCTYTTLMNKDKAVSY